ncbi:flagellar basal-body rod protein FlgG [Humisphaera borealis]|uniref:Flagellar basal-body rod protein FlgG n=1 Tax=Humisphaera borealis TaxID=2807512 RepID=A0A7M2X272_9BACT|nr:flagellar basal-body rod protein FlgG [Humisphaera borealis]QOV91532.1 flagellar basal-body rod protein FlgG [Humisphaera borealis]
MAITALHSAATGLRALSTRIDVVANNLANAETTAFKRARLNFEDLMYLALRQPGTTNGAGDVSPAGIFVGLGTKISNSQLDLEQGSMENTGRPLDVGIQGAGFFKVKIMDSIGGGTGYTRNGNFFVNNVGELVLGIGDGYKLIPPITIPPNTSEISISQDGNIEVIIGGQTTKQNVGQLSVTSFINPQGLQLQGGSIYTETGASGQPVDNVPGEGGTGQLLQGFLEASNVDPVKELVTLIKTQRAFELNSQSIQTADQALQTIGNLRRG